MKKLKKENKRNIFQKAYYEIKNNNSLNKSFGGKIKHKSNSIYEINIFKFLIIMNLILQALPMWYHIQ